MNGVIIEYFTFLGDIFQLTLIVFDNEHQMLNRYLIILINILKMRDSMRNWINSKEMKVICKDAK
jgi:hypothetical protein